jgi:hypothetical protein
MGILLQSRDKCVKILAIETRNTPFTVRDMCALVISVEIRRVAAV